MKIVFIIQRILMSMTLDPWANLAGGEQDAKTKALVGGIDTLILTIGISGAAASFIAAAIMLLRKNARKREQGKERLFNTVIIILCLSGLTFIVGTIVDIIKSI